MLKSHWKRWLVVPVALVLALSLIGGCQTAAEVDDGEPEAEPEDITIKLADTEYEAAWLMNALADFILGNGYGYTVEAVSLGVPVAQVSLSKGDIDAWLDCWWWYYLEWYNPAIENEEIENLGRSMEPAPSFWVIPEYTHEQLGIESVFDLKDHWEAFKDPEDPSKGLFINCPIGWQCQQINQIKLEAYGLTEYFNISESTYAGLDAALAGAQLKEEHVVGYYWAPTAMMGRFDWYILEEPEYDPEVWDQIMAAVDDDSLRPLDEAVAYEAVSPVNAIWSGLREKAPEAVAVFEKMDVGLEQTNQTSAWVQENEVENWEKAAIWYMREYPNRWKGWVSPSALPKVQAALDEYPPVP